MPVTWIARPADPQAWPLPPAAITHPRTAGTFSRALRLLTREGSRAVSGEGSRPRGGGQLSLGQALAKCSLEPARLLQDRVPALRGKGRLQAGGDADIVVFDPDTITDRASYQHSTRTSAGIRHVLVNGAFVVRDGDLVADARPGRPVRAEPRRAALSRTEPRRAAPSRAAGSGPGGAALRPAARARRCGFERS
jgi:N-acyl-D-aspartate/D-glutamate deacylase